MESAVPAVSVHGVHLGGEKLAPSLLLFGEAWMAASVLATRRPFLTG